MKTIFPGYAPTVIARRKPPLSPIQNSPGTFDDKMVVVDASPAGKIRGNAIPLLLDLARKPVFLHDDSVVSLESLLDPERGRMAPHPFYVGNHLRRRDVVDFLKSLDTGGQLMISIQLDHPTFKGGVSSVRLSRRELEVLRLVAQGYQSQHAADILFVSKSTVDFHLANVFGKLGVNNRMQALQAARRLAMLPFEP